MMSMPTGLVALFDEVLLREEFDGPVARPVNADLSAGHDAETVFEADLCTGIESEELTGEIAEIAGAERAREPMRDPERAAEPWNLQGRGQPDDREVRLRRIHARDRWPLAGPADR